MQPILTRFLMIFSLLAVSSTSAFSQGETPKDAYQSAWSEVSELLRKREYASAIAKLDSLTEERDLRDYGKQIEADKKAIDGLQVLERIVLEQAAQLEAGSTIEISGIEYTVAGYQKSTRGDSLVLKSKSLGRETRKPVADLPSGTWVELAEADLAPLDNAPLTLGIFLAFDRIADRKAARKLLNEAASHGHDVTPWLARLDAEEATKKAGIKGDDDPIVGKWAGWFGPPPKPIISNYEFRKDGTGVMTIDSKVLDGYLQIHGKTPDEYARIKQGFRRMTFKWERKDDGSYVLMSKEGMTVPDIHLDGDKMSWPIYRDFVRQIGR